MQEKIVPVCFSANGAENVLEAVEGLGTYRFVLLHDDLSLGPLRALDTEAGRHARFDYLLKTNATDDDLDWRKYLLQFQNRMGLVDLFPPPALDESALVWFGDMGNEQLLLRAVCASWPDTDIYLADIRRIAHKHKAHKNYVPCFPPEVLRELVSLAQLLPIERKQALADEWHELTRQDHVVRIYQNEKILGVKEDFFDALLLESCTKEWQFQARVAGNCQANSGYSSVGDVFLFYRLHQMAQRGLVEIQRGQHEDYRFDKIRKL